MARNLHSDDKRAKWAVMKILFWPILGWVLFYYGYCLIAAIAGTTWKNTFLVYSPAIPVFFIISGLFYKYHNSSQFINKYLESHTHTIDNIPDPYLNIFIALAAGLSLFMELMIIRIHSSCFQLFAYFKNISLLSCFLGLGIGYARGQKKSLATPFVLPFLTVQVVFMFLLRHSDINMHRWLENPVLEQLAFGIKQIKFIDSLIFVYGFLILIFVSNALCFVPIGQLCSRLMMRREKLVAYSWNLIGSLGGIILFTLLSFFWSPPLVWIIVASLGIMLFFYNDIRNLIFSILSVIIMSVILSFPFHLNRFDIYSPYQILTFSFGRDFKPVLETSNTYYQSIFDLSKESVEKNKDLKQWLDFYNTPYYFKPNPKDVLIVGSGTGNDVVSALRNGAGKIDAVEIDPAILLFGRNIHPESPYQAKRVRSFTNDARTFIRHTDRRYDLIVYGLLDSHTLLSGASGGIRLDSYVYTVEAFRDARQILKKGGVISVTFGLVGSGVTNKIFLMLKEAFDGQKPIVYQSGYQKGITYLIGEGIEGSSFEVPNHFNNLTSLFPLKGVTVDKSTDDWPFLYMPRKMYPFSYVVVILILLVVSWGVISQLIPVSGSGGWFSLPCFFLGAGFMLIETKAITELALLYGSSWIVTSVVIAAILIMAFLANMLVMKGKAFSTTVTYGFLCVSLFVGLSMPYFDGRNIPLFLMKLIMPTVLTLPIFFSGFAFSSEFKKSSSAAVALSSNILGAMFGGFLEYNSMYFGFRALYFFAIVMYIIAFGASLRTGKVIKTKL